MREILIPEREGEQPHRPYRTDKAKYKHLKPYIAFFLLYLHLTLVGWTPLQSETDKCTSIRRRKSNLTTPSSAYPRLACVPFMNGIGTANIVHCLSRRFIQANFALFACC
jgi:hypothetical protein